MRTTTHILATTLFILPALSERECYEPNVCYQYIASKRGGANGSVVPECSERDEDTCYSILESLLEIPPSLTELCEEFRVQDCKVVWDSLRNTLDHLYDIELPCLSQSPVENVPLINAAFGYCFELSKLAQESEDAGLEDELASDSTGEEENDLSTTPVDSVTTLPWRPTRTSTGRPPIWFWRPWYWSHESLFFMTVASAVFVLLLISAVLWAYARGLTRTQVRVTRNYMNAQQAALRQPVAIVAVPQLQIPQAGVQQTTSPRNYAGRDVSAQLVQGETTGRGTARTERDEMAEINLDMFR